MSEADANLRSRAYGEIRRKILAAEIPPGSALSEYQLSATLNISRTPIREALRRLEREGLVVAIAQRGTFVAEMSARDIMEVYQIREELEGFAARVAAERLGREAIDRLEAELMQAMASLPKTPALARKAFPHLHAELVAVTQNQRMKQLLNTLEDQMQIVRNLAASSADRVKQAITEHLAVVRAIRGGNGDQAEEAMRQHLRSARDNLSKLVLPAGYD